MNSFQIKFRLPPNADAISKLPALIQANVFKALQQGMTLAASISQTKYLTGPRPSKLGVVTGMLRASVKGGAYLGGGPGVFAMGVLKAGWFGASMKYAAIHEYGGTTPPHTIIPRTKTVLKFFWKKANMWRYAKRIYHPGSVIPARPYLLPAMMDVQPIIENMIQTAIDRAFKDS